MTRDELFTFSEYVINFSFAGEVFAATRMNTSTARKEFGGIVADQSDFNLRCWSADFNGVFPVVGDLITIDDKQYRVLATSHFLPFFKMSLGGKYAIR